MSLWPAAAATMVGSLPGTDSAEAARIVAGELADFIAVPELPARGPGADIIGRTLGLLAQTDLAFGAATTPTGWRVAGSITAAMRTARSFLGEDLDQIEEAAQGYRGPLKFALCGPWTLSAAVELPNGQPVLSDHGAVREVADGLAMAVQHLTGILQSRFPLADTIFQLDEPSLPAVLAGKVPTASGWGTLRSVQPAVVSGHLERVFEAGPVGVHCCSAAFPVDLVVGAGAQFISFDALSARPSDEAVSRAWEKGVGIIAGVAALRSGPATDEAISRAARRYLEDLGFTDHRYLQTLAISPPCGLAGYSLSAARAVLKDCHTIGRILRNEDEMPVQQDEV